MDTNKAGQNVVYEQFKMISFFLGGQEYAVDILNIKEVIRTKEIARLPKSPEFVIGVINLRGEILPLIDLRKKFGLDPMHYNNGRIIVVEVDNRLIGILVDDVKQVIRIGSDQIVKAPPLKGHHSSQYIKGVGKIDNRLIIILNIEEILSTDEKIELEELDYLLEEDKNK